MDDHDLVSGHNTLMPHSGQSLASMHSEDSNFSVFATELYRKDRINRLSINFVVCLSIILLGPTAKQTEDKHSAMICSQKFINWLLAEDKLVAGVTAHLCPIVDTMQTMQGTKLWSKAKVMIKAYDES